MDNLLPPEVIRMLLEHIDDFPRRTAVERVCRLFKYLNMTFVPIYGHFTVRDQLYHVYNQKKEIVTRHYYGPNDNASKTKYYKTEIEIKDFQYF